MAMTYEVVAYREEGFWIVEVPDLDLLTQAVRLDEVERMARSIISLDQDLDRDSIAVSVTVRLSETVQQDLDQSRKLRAQADEASHRAAALSRDAARRLHDDGLPLRDVGSILGVSVQRAQQLVKS